MAEFIDLDGARAFLNKTRNEFHSYVDEKTKIENATGGNIPALDSNGKLIDSGRGVANDDDVKAYLDGILN